jgi:hypothetical protein
LTIRPNHARRLCRYKTAISAATTTAIARRIHGTALLLDLEPDAERLDAVVVGAVVVVDLDVVVELDVVVVVLDVVVVLAVVVVGAALTFRLALMPTLPPPQRTPMLYEPGGVDTGMA